MTNDYDLMYGELESVLVGGKTGWHGKVEAGLGGVMMVFEEAHWRC